MYVSRFSELLGTLQTLTFCGLHVSGTYTKGPYVKQDHKSIIEDKRPIIDNKWFMHKLYDAYYVFYEIKFVLIERKLISLFHTVGKKAVA